MYISAVHTKSNYYLVLSTYYDSTTYISAVYTKRSAKAPPMANLPEWGRGWGWGGAKGWGLGVGSGVEFGIGVMLGLGMGSP